MNDKKLLRQIIYCLQFGFNIVITFLVSIVIGIQLDKYLDTKPVFTLLLIFVAFGLVIKMLLGAGKDE